MTTFDNREKAAEGKYVHDEEMKFKAEARRNKHLGIWAAGLLGKSGADADAYAKTVIAADFQEVGDEDVFRKLRADFDAAGVTVADTEIRQQMVTLLAQSLVEVKAGL